MFETLTDKLTAIFSRLKARGKLSTQDIKKGLREIKLALLEADVNYLIVKKFIKDVEVKASEERVQKSLTPGQQIVKIVNQELISLMKSYESEIKIPDNKVSKFMIVGLQGCGKTTVCAKLALLYKKKNNNPLLVATDIHRPAAIDQLQTLAKSIDITIYSEDSTNIDKIAKGALKLAQKKEHNIVIFDTAGRLHVDDRMMKEIKSLSHTIKPDEILYVADAMTGQDAVNSAKEFNEQLNLTGLILSKLDGDARGGAAISIKSITNKPIKYVSVGEKLNQLEIFHADRIVSRILGKGDVLSLIEKAESTYKKEEAVKLQKKLKKNLFTLEDFLQQINKLKKMGPMEEIFKMLPGAGSKMMKNIHFDERDIKHIEAIIYSMTPKERNQPEILNGSRRKRIAKGSGTSIQQLNRLLKQFSQMKKMIKNMKSGKFNLNKPFFPM